MERKYHDSICRTQQMEVQAPQPRAFLGAHSLLDGAATFLAAASRASRSLFQRLTASDVPESKRACPWGEKDCAWLIFQAPAYRPIATAAGSRERIPMLPRRLEMV